MQSPWVGHPPIFWPQRCSPPPKLRLLSLPTMPWLGLHPSSLSQPHHLPSPSHHVHKPQLHISAPTQPPPQLSKLSCSCFFPFPTPAHPSAAAQGKALGNSSGKVLHYFLSCQGSVGAPGGSVCLATAWKAGWLLLTFHGDWVGPMAGHNGRHLLIVSSRLCAELINLCQHLPALACQLWVLEPGLQHCCCPNPAGKGVGHLAPHQPAACGVTGAKRFDVTCRMW